MSAARSVPPRAEPATARLSGRAPPPRTPADADLGFELYRQHTLLVVLGASLRYAAARVLETKDPKVAEVDRALQIHHDYVVLVHYPDEDRVLDALEPSKDPAVFDSIVECKAEHPLASYFEGEVAREVRALRPGDAAGVRTLARRLRAEADRMERHLAREEEGLTSKLGRWLTPSEQTRLLRQIREFDNRKITAETNLLAWAAEIGPSAD